MLKEQRVILFFIIVILLVIVSVSLYFTFLKFDQNTNTGNVDMSEQIDEIPKNMGEEPPSSDVIIEPVDGTEDNSKLPGTESVLPPADATQGDEDLPNNSSEATEGSPRAEESVQTKLQQCPDAWYENRMPQVLGEGEAPQPFTQYFIYNGERKELSEVDVLWVELNCDVNEPSIVY